MVRIFRHYVCAKLALLMCLESAVLLASVFLGSLLYHPAVGEAITRPFLLGSEAAFPVAMFILATGMGLYQVDAWSELRSAQVRLLSAGILAGLIAFTAMAFAPSLTVSPAGLVLTVASAVFASSALRYAFHKWDRTAKFKSRVLVLGTGSRVAKLAERSLHHQSHRIVGFVEPGAGQHFIPPARVLEMKPGESLLALSRRHGVHEIVVGTRERRDGGATVQELLRCKMNGVRITELSTFFEREYRQVILQSLNPSWMVFGDGFRQGFWTRVMKRAFDVVVSFVLLLLAAPLMLAAMVLIALESGFPVFYRQERVGQGGRRFTICKLRTMKKDSERAGAPVWASAQDPRTTALGRMLRKFRIDELPQVINVLRGDMSFVGPRPERPFFVDKLSEQIPYYGLRHTVKPGITGWAQVRYPYGANVDDAVEKLQYDLYYLKNNSVFLDLLILFATLEVVLWGKGAR